MKKTISLFAFSLVLVLVVVMSYLRSENHYLVSIFSDVPEDHDNYDAISHVKASGIVQGYGDGTYKPDVKINRAEFITIVMNGLHPGVSEGGFCFPDVQDEWFAKFICTAKEKGIIAGYPDGTFKPSDHVSFVEAAKIIISAGPGNATLQVQTMEMLDNVWYENFVKALEFRQAIPLTIDSFSKKITRGEMAEIFYRLSSAAAKPSLTYNSLKDIDKITHNDSLSDNEKQSQRDVIVESVVDAHNQALEQEKARSSCGDGVCSADEAGSSCPSDCGDDAGDHMTDDATGHGDDDNANNVPDGANNEHVNDNDEHSTTGACEKNADIKFSTSFMDYESINYLVPPGSIHDGTVRESSIISFKDGEIPVYAPYDGDLMMGAYYKENPDDEKGLYSLQFRASCEISFNFNKLRDAPSAIAAAFPDGPSQHSGEFGLSQYKIHVKAGDVIGYATQVHNFNEISFALFDTTQLNVFANSDRYRQESSVSARCPFDYFDDAIRDEYYKKLADVKGVKPTVAPDQCRQPSQDVSGTVSGEWFSEKYDPYNQAAHGTSSSGHFSIGMLLDDKRIVMDYSDSSKNVYIKDFYVNEGNPTFKRPDAMTEGYHCYSTDYNAGLVHIDVVSNDEIRLIIDQKTGLTCPNEFPEHDPANEVMTFYR